MSFSRFPRSLQTLVVILLLAVGLPAAGQSSLPVSAAPGDSDATFVPLTPCRLFDTRPAPSTVGLRSSPLGASDTMVQPVTGSNGDCTGIPADAVAVSLNVTVVGGTATSFLTVFPADLTEPPASSNLNWRPGAAPTPNKVDVKLSPDGSIKLFNSAGSVNVLADIAGYYTSASLAELASDVGALESRVAALESAVAALDAATPFAASFSDSAFIVLEETSNFGFPTGGHTELARVTMTAPVDGHVSANFSARTATQVAAPSDTQFQCHLTDEDATGLTSLQGDFNIFFSADTDTDEVPISVTRGFDVVAGQTITVYAFCRVTTDAMPPSSVGGRDLTAIFTPDP